LTVFIFICSLFQIGESAHISLTEQRHRKAVCRKQTSALTFADDPHSPRSGNARPLTMLH
jgi:hypothetical protein